MDAVTERSLKWVRRAGEYRLLAGKRDLGCPLEVREAARLEELELFFTAGADPERAPFITRHHERAAVSLVVTFRGPTGELGGRLRDLSGEGMFVETTRALPAGAMTIVRILDPLRGDEWRFGAEVVRVEQAGLAFRLVGIPLALRLGHRALPHAA